MEMSGWPFVVVSSKKGVLKPVVITGIQDILFVFRQREAGQRCQRIILDVIVKERYNLICRQVRGNYPAESSGRGIRL